MVGREAALVVLALDVYDRAWVTLSLLFVLVLLRVLALAGSHLIDSMLRAAAMPVRSARRSSACGPPAPGGRSGKRLLDGGPHGLVTCAFGGFCCFFVPTSLCRASRAACDLPVRGIVGRSYHARSPSRRCRQGRPIRTSDRGPELSC